MFLMVILYLFTYSSFSQMKTYLILYIPLSYLSTDHHLSVYPSKNLSSSSSITCLVYFMFSPYCCQGNLAKIQI